MLSLLMIAACKETKKQALNDFEKFYEQFHADSLYQIEHITFPLDGLPGLVMEQSDSLSNFKWRKAGWKYQKKVDFESGLFNQSLSDTNGTITELICDNDGFCLERRFAKIGRDWYLIYFVDMNFRGKPNAD